jgi:hypothetical protein
VKGTVFDVRRDGGVLCAGVLRDVRQRLGHDEVGGRLDLGRETSHGQADLHGHRHPTGDPRDCCAQPAPPEDRGKDALHELAQLDRCLLGVVERLGQERRGVLIVSPKRPTGQLERDHGVDEALLRPVVQVALDLPASLVGGRDDARPGRGELGPALRIGDRGTGELGEGSHALLGIGWELRALRAGGDRAPERPLDDDRDRHRATDPQSLDQLPHRLWGVAVVVDASGPAGSYDPGQCHGGLESQATADRKRVARGPVAGDDDHRPVAIEAPDGRGLCVEKPLHRVSDG